MPFFIPRCEVLRLANGRHDLITLDLSPMPHFVINDLRRKLDLLLKCFSFCIGDNQLLNSFSRNHIDAYNVNDVPLELNVTYKITISVIGMHMDKRMGNTFVPIMIIDSAVSRI